jgi:hypothetical protein
LGFELLIGDDRRVGIGGRSRLRLLFLLLSLRMRGGGKRQSASRDSRQQNPALIQLMSRPAFRWRTTLVKKVPYRNR